MSKKKEHNASATYQNFLNQLSENTGFNAGDHYDFNINNADRMEFGSGMTNADIQAFYANEWAAQNQRAYETEMANTAWQRGVVDMQAAGLNPALAYGQGGAATPSGAAGTASATQFNGLQTILGFVGDIVGKLTSMAEGTMAMFKQSAEIRNLNAQNENLRTQNIVLGEQARNYGAEATAREIENQYKNQSEEAKLSILSAQKDDIVAAMNLKQAQAATESERKSVEIWKAAVEKANANQIEALTPELVRYQKAATANQRAQAALAATDKAYKQGLIDNGQIEAIIDEVESKIESNKSSSDFQKASAALAKWKLAVREGHAFPNDPDWENMIWQEYPAESCMWLLRGAANKFLQGVSALTDAIGGKPSVK